MNEWDDVFSPDEETVLTLVGRQFPELVTNELRRLGEGFDCVAFLVGDWVFRFPRRPFGVQTLTTEATVLPQLGQEVLVGKPDPEFPYPFLATRFQPGVPLDEYHGPRKRLAQMLGNELARIHGLPVPNGTPPDPVGKFHMPRRRKQIGERLGTIPDWVPIEPPSNPELLVHGDVHCRHIYVSPVGELQGLIDWGDVCTGHPAIDLASAWAYFEPEDRDQFWAAYGEVSEETLLYSRFRALYHTLLLRDYARDQALEDVYRESVEGVRRILEG
ncbi:MAG: phosphotransferase [Candidatus Eremiobacteraeota bacterium]|nr:phosphotransferase [Candidatus Eremiobacteraeota bacterium]